MTDWFEKENGLFGKEYYLRHKSFCTTQRTMTEVDFICKHLDIHKATLDLGCGYGRHSIELAKRGFDVTGVDLSQELLSLAQRKTVLNGVNITFRQEDMRRLDTRRKYGNIICLYTSFGYFKSSDEHMGVLKNVADTLEDGKSIFILEIYNYSKKITELTSLKKQTLENGTELLFDHFLRENHLLSSIYNTKTGEKIVRSLTLFKPGDIIHMATNSGLQLVGMFGNYQEDAYGEYSDYFITKWKLQ